MSDHARPSKLRIAAAGDVHCSEAHRDEIAEAVARIGETADVVLFAGDLTTHGEPEQGAVLAAACAPLEIPVFAVLGNHDWHANRSEELVQALSEGGIQVLERSWSVCEASGLELGIVGLKGFVGGYPGSHLPDFGEPLLREVYAETTRDVEALEEGLRAIELCPVRVVLLHYAPSTQTIIGEPEGIWPYLGNDRLAAPIAQHEPDLVLHGHAHAGMFQGAIDSVPVYNVSVPVMGRDFWLFELDVASPAHAPIH